SRSPVPARSDRRTHRGRDSFGAVAFAHVDHGYHRRGQLIDIADIGEIALRGATQRLRRDAVEQDEAEIAVRPARRLAGVELLPAEMKNGLGLLSRNFPL